MVSYTRNTIIVFIILTIYLGFFAVIGFVSSGEFNKRRLFKHFFWTAIIAAILTFPALRIVRILDRYLYDEDSSQQWLYSSEDKYKGSSTDGINELPKEGKTRTQLK